MKRKNAFINAANGIGLCIRQEDFHPLIKIVKDTAAGAVFLSAAGSAVMGAVIFLPKIIHQIKLLTT